MNKTVLLIIILTFVGKITGFLREAVMASQIGANAYTDVYNFSYGVVILFTSLVLSGMYTALVPVLSNAEQDGRMKQFFDKILSLMIPFLLTLFLLVMLFAPVLLELVAPGLDDEYRTLAIQYTRILSANVFFVGLQSTFIGYLQKANRFLLAASMAIPLNTGIIAGILFSSPTNIMPLILGTVAGEALVLVWLLYGMKQTGYRLSWNLDVKGDPYLKLFLAMISPVMISLAATQLNSIVDKAIASLLPAGSASYLNYAQKLQTIFFSVIVVSLMTVLFTKQSELASQKRFREIYLLTKKNLSILLMIIIPTTVGLMFLNQEIAMIAYMRNQFSRLDARVTGWLLFIYAGVIIFQTISDMLTKMLFSLKETKKPMMTTVIGIVVNIGLNLILMRFMGVYGLALATTISVLVRMLLMLYFSKHYYSQDIGSIFTRSSIKYSLAALVMAGGLWLLREYSPLGQMGLYSYTIIAIVIGIGIYFGSLFVLRTEELKEIKIIISSMLRRANPKKS